MQIILNKRCKIDGETFPKGAKLKVLGVECEGETSKYYFYTPKGKVDINNAKVAPETGSNKE